MKMEINGVLIWFCSQCGYYWRMRCESTPPERCAKCRHRGWQRDRDDEAEC
jgi:rubrerythrin